MWRAWNEETVRLWILDSMPIMNSYTLVLINTNPLRYLEVNSHDLREATHDGAVEVIRNADTPVRYDNPSLSLSRGNLLNYDSNGLSGKFRLVQNWCLRSPSWLSLVSNQFQVNDYFIASILQYISPVCQCCFSRVDIFNTTLSDMLGDLSVIAK